MVPEQNANARCADERMHNAQTPTDKRLIRLKTMVGSLGERRNGRENKECPPDGQGQTATEFFAFTVFVETR